MLQPFFLIFQSGSGVSRQASQSSLLEQFAAQAKELVRETTRQSSQEGLLAHMDKVFCEQINCFFFLLKVLLAHFNWATKTEPVFNANAFFGLSSRIKTIDPTR